MITKSKRPVDQIHEDAFLMGVYRIHDFIKTIPTNLL